MNKRLTILIILLGSAILCQSQDYRCIYPGDTPFYVNKYTCGYLPKFDGCFPDKVYYKGLGGPFGYCDDHFNGGFWEHKLVYFNKGEETWGTPFEINLSVKTEGMPEKLFTVYPVPANDHFYILNVKHLNNCVVDIVDITGDILFCQNLELSSTIIDTGKYKAGIYIYTGYQEMEK